MEPGKLAIVIQREEPRPHCQILLGVYKLRGFPCMEVTVNLHAMHLLF